jgi:transposase
MQSTTIGIDISKSIFQLHGVDRNGRRTFQQKVRRAQFIHTLSGLPPALIGMEACASSHYWSRRITELGHQVKLINPAFVTPYVKSQKNDAHDAEAICEAVSRPSMRFVPCKSIEQQDIQALHRVRTRLVKQRTALVNQIRGLLGEYGLVAPRGIQKIRKLLPELIEDDQLSARSQLLFTELRDEFLTLDERIDGKDQELRELAQSRSDCERLMTIPGIGPLTATAIVMSVGRGTEFKNGRHMAAFIGLVPRQHSTGGRNRLGHITKRGDRYLRTLLIHGARSLAMQTYRGSNAPNTWLRNLIERRGFNLACVAMANKMARQAWCVLTSGGEYQPHAYKVAP